MTFAASFIRRLVGIFYLLLFMTGLITLILVVLFFMAVHDLPRVPEPLNRIIETPPTEIYTTTGERLMMLGEREAVNINRVSTHFLKAVIATEDHRFWDHHGLNKLRTLKALWITLFKHGKIQGASTITQQLAKNLFFSFKQSYIRKFRELLVALQIESRYSKKEIIEAYINQIPFGARVYGVERAAKAFFNKPASELSLAESALLAGLPKSPTRYNPYLHFDRAKKRQRVVLLRMVSAGYLDRARADQIFREPLKLRMRPSGARTGSYFLDMVIKKLEQKYGPDIVYHGGLKVTTTLDPQLQKQGEESIKKGLLKLDRIMGMEETAGYEKHGLDERPQGALVAVETNSGAVKALVGGRDYFETEYNRALQNNRQPGSGFKPFVYYTAFESLGVNPGTPFWDRKIKIPVKGAPDWSPRNFSRRNEGPMVLKRAFMKSVNTVAAQLVEQTGPAEIIRVAHGFGIQSRLAPVYSLALGSSGVSPLEMASAFATLATGGIRHDPFCIWRVEDAMGRVLEEHIVTNERVMDAGIVYQVVDMMKGVVDSGTGAVARRMGFELPAAGKTGTSNSFNDAWFTGFTPTLSASVWVGFDRNKPLRDSNGKGITGGRGAAPIWSDFMIHATSGEPAREFSIPPDIRFRTIDPVTGLAVGNSAKDGLRVALRKGQNVPFADSTVVDAEQN